jgi:cytochrome c oxidase subunit 1
MLIFLFNFVMSTLFWREKTEDNPYNSRSLEWQLPTPVPAGNFERIPVILSTPYEYGDPNALPIADLHPPIGVVASAYVGATTADETAYAGATAGKE